MLLVHAPASVIAPAVPSLSISAPSAALSGMTESGPRAAMETADALVRCSPFTAS